MYGILERMILGGDATAKTQSENLKLIFPEKELRCLSPKFHVHVSVSDLYISTIGLPIMLQENMWTDPGDCGLFWEYISGIFVAMRTIRSMGHGLSSRGRFVQGAHHPRNMFVDTSVQDVLTFHTQ